MVSCMFFLLCPLTFQKPTTILASAEIDLGCLEHDGFSHKSNTHNLRRTETTPQLAWSLYCQKGDVDKI